MNNFRRQPSSEFRAKRNGRPSLIAGIANITMIMISVVFLISMISGVESFFVKHGNRDFICRDIKTKHHHQQQQQQQQQLYTTVSFLLPISTFHGHYSSSKLMLSSSSSSLSLSEGLEFSSAATNTTSSNTTVTGNGSKMEDRKSYNEELEEAVAQQMREKNPLLGIKSIGVDYGLVRTGVAVTIGYNPEALDVIVTDHPLLRDDEAEGMLEADVEKEEERRLEIQRSTVTERVVELAFRENADRIVVGLPLYKNGTEAPQSTLARKFARDHLAIATLRTLGPGVSVYMCDERYTSKEAAARMRSSQPSRNSNNDLYGLLDTESAKIILEQYYDDHLDRYNANTRNLGDSDCETTKNMDPGSYNGELVTIADADLVKDLTLEYNENRLLQREQLATERNDREARVKWRKLEMEKDRIRAKKEQEENAANGIVALKKKKKKKKKKRK